MNWLLLLPYRFQEFVDFWKMCVSDGVMYPPHVKNLSWSTMTRQESQFPSGKSGKDSKTSPFCVVSTVEEIAEPIGTKPPAKIRPQSSELS